MPNLVKIKFPHVTLEGSPEKPGLLGRIRCAISMVVHETLEVCFGSKVAHSTKSSKRYAMKPELLALAPELMAGGGAAGGAAGGAVVGSAATGASPLVGEIAVTGEAPAIAGEIASTPDAAVGGPSAPKPGGMPGGDMIKNLSGDQFGMIGPGGVAKAIHGLFKGPGVGNLNDSDTSDPGYAS